jgi:hypothetical protein
MIKLSLLGPLNPFYEELKSNILQAVVMEDGASVHKGVCKKLCNNMKWTQFLHPPNSLDLNPIENIWAWMKHEITTKYMYVCMLHPRQRCRESQWKCGKIWEMIKGWKKVSSVWNLSNYRDHSTPKISTTTNTGPPIFWSLIDSNVCFLRHEQRESAICT